MTPTYTAYEGFNPRLREGGDLDGTLYVVVYPVSIHASAKEATISSRSSLITTRVSIHASAKEATFLLVRNFQ